MSPGSLYKATISASLSDSDYESTDFVWLDVGYADVVSVISGGSRTTSIYNTVSFDASSSYDPDSASAALDYTWKQVDGTVIGKTPYLR